MKHLVDELSLKLKEKGLKVTPQRILVLQAIYALDNHPTAESIIETVRKEHPSIATGTVYKVLEVLVEKELIKRVKSEKDIFRYDGILEPHHHLYCTKCDAIEDYMDEGLNALLEAYFEENEIPGFEIEDIVLQVKGKFKDESAHKDHKLNQK